MMRRRRPAHRALVTIVPAVALVASGCSLSPIDLSQERPLSRRSTIRAADGSVLARLFRENRIVVPLKRIPAHLIDAVLAAEDSRFFEHRGYDVRAIARAAIVNARENKVVQGGSTITQQYVKNTFFTKPSRTVERKARELRLAIEIEERYSKSEILERYLNTIYFGEGAYGVAAAAEVYFRKRLSELTRAQSALLAGLIKAPTDYDPRAHPERSRARRNRVLAHMVELGRIDIVTARRAMNEPLGVTPDPPRIALRQPYFVEAVKRELMRDGRLGMTGPERAHALYRAGLEVHTTLDLKLQRAAEAAVRRVLWSKGDPAAALVAIRPKTGEIVAMVSGRNWKLSQVNLALGRAGGGSGRQAGSAFKPFVLAAALESGIPLRSEYESTPGVFRFDQYSEPWVVGNYEGRGYGLLSLDEAMIRSVNGVYARLALQIGAAAIANQAHLMGVRSRLPSVPSIALGSAEVSVLEMAAGYATLANHGTYVQPTAIKRIRVPGGKVFEPDQQIVEGALAPGNAYLITKVLEGVIARGTGVGAGIGRPAAGKTGTTNDYSDAWFVGYTPDLVTAVWVGYPHGRVPMTSVHGIRVAGGTLPASIWREFMRVALRGVAPRAFTFPRTELVTVFIDPASGLLAAPWCGSKKKTMLRQLVPTESCPLPPAPPPEPVATPTASPIPNPKDDDKRTEPDAKESPKPKPKPKPTPTS